MVCVNWKIITRPTLVKDVGNVWLRHFVAELGKQGVYDQGAVDVTLAVEGMSLHNHLRPLSSFGNILEQLQASRIIERGTKTIKVKLQACKISQ